MNELISAVLELQEVLNWVGPIVNGRSDAWKAVKMQKAIDLAKKLDNQPASE